MTYIIFSLVLRFFITFSKRPALVLEGDSLAHAALLDKRLRAITAYPTVFHSIIDYTVGRLPIKYPGIINYIFFSIFIIGYELIYGLSLESTLYIIVISVLVDEYTIHMYHFGERFLISLIIGFISYELISGDIYITHVLVPLLIFMSKFARQWVVFVIIPTLIFDKHFIDFSIMVSIVSLTILAHRGTWISIKGQISHLRNYKNFATFNSKKLFVRFHALRICMYPELILLWEQSSTFVLVLIVVYFFTSLTKFGNFGESWRYIDWAVFVPTLVYISGESAIYLIGLKIAGFYLFQMIYNIYLNKNQSKKRTDNLIAALSKVPQDKKIFAIPYRTSDEIRLVNPVANLVCCHLSSGYSTIGKGLVYKEELITEDVYCVVSKNYLNTMQITYSERINSATIIYENDDFKVLYPQ